MDEPEFDPQAEITKLRAEMRTLRIQSAGKIMALSTIVRSLVLAADNRVVPSRAELSERIDKAELDTLQGTPTTGDVAEMSKAMGELLRSILASPPRTPRR